MPFNNNKGVCKLLNELDHNEITNTNNEENTNNENIVEIKELTEEELEKEAATFIVSEVLDILDCLKPRKVMEKYKAIERSIITTYRSKIWSKFIKAIKEYDLIQDKNSYLTRSQRDTIIGFVGLCMIEMTKGDESGSH